MRLSFTQYDALITSDTTYYVSASSGDDANDGSVTAPWETVEHALDTLRPYRIAPGVSATIQIDDGLYTLSESIADLPEGIVIEGKNTLSRSITSIQSSSGVSGNYTLVLNIDDVSGISTGDELQISSCSGGTNPNRLAGTHDITAVDAANSRITIKSTHDSGMPSGAVSATLTVYKTVLFTPGNHGVNNVPIIVQNLALLGDATVGSRGVSSSHAEIVLSNCGIRNYDLGAYVTRQGHLSFEDVGVGSIAGKGLSALERGSIYVTGGAVNGCGSFGVLAQYNAEITLTSCVIAGNASNQIRAYRDSSIFAISCDLEGTSACFAGIYGLIELISGTTYSGTLSPAANTQGNEYGYIRV